MAGSISGIGQQVPLSQTFQPGGDEKAKVARDNQEQQPQENVVQTRGAALGQTNGSETKSRDDTSLIGRPNRNNDNTSLSAENDNVGSSSRRGSLLNIVV